MSATQFKVILDDEQISEAVENRSNTGMIKITQLINLHEVDVTEVPISYILLQF